MGSCVHMYTGTQLCKVQARSRAKYMYVVHSRYTGSKDSVRAGAQVKLVQRYSGAQQVHVRMFKVHI